MMKMLLHRRTWQAAFFTSALFLIAIGTIAQESTNRAPAETLLLKDYRPRSIYKIPRTDLKRARFPVIDMHSHAYPRTRDQVDAWVRTMDEMGVEKTVILSSVTGGAFDEVVARFSGHPDRFSIWCGFDYTGFDQPGYGPAAAAELERCVKAGAEGVGELSDKGAGLKRTTNGPSLHIDDPRLAPLIDKCGDLRIPINIHVAEPIWMYEPMDRENDGLMNAFIWRLDNQTNILSHAEVVATLEKAVKRHPRTTFIACHFANCCYDLTILERMLDACPNLYADIAARYAETAPVPRATAKFYKKYSDRLLYGTDMGVTKDMYLTTFRILETEDEHFYDWNHFTYHWPLQGLGLNDAILRKVYSKNARKLLKPRK
jgi:predicted TIM-barrel fold metal-dependent hydrolase